jgi:predicted enzyme related to lactoylglutathione lyase
MINVLEIIFFELVVREYQLAAAFYSENRQLKWFGRSYDREI